MQPSTAILRTVDLSGEICVHVWNYDTAASEENFQASHQNCCREAWLLKEVCQIFPATCAWSMHLKTKYNYSEQEVKAHQRICDIPSHWGLGDLNLIPARTKAWTFTLKVSCSVFWTCGNMLFRHNGPQSWGIRTTPAHARPVWRGSLWQGSKGHWASPQMVKFPSWKRFEYFLVWHSWLNNEKMEAWRG